MDEFDAMETVEIDPDRWISLEYTRRWPKYVVDWYVRQREGDTDFPVATGTVEELPEGRDRETIQQSLHERALQQANAAAAGTGSERQGRSFLDRLLRRG